MGLRIFVVLAVLTGVTGSPSVTVRPEADPGDMFAYPNSVPEMLEDTDLSGQKEEEGEAEEVMATGQLNPNYYPAHRSAAVVQHYLNSCYGSPFRLFRVLRVHSVYAEDVPDSGRKYQLEMSIQEVMSNKTEKCSAEVLFPRGQRQGTAQVQASCEELLKVNTSTQDEAFYQEYKMNQSLVSAQNLPDSYGHTDPIMEPLRTLGTVAASFIMLNESTENTLYNFAQVANLTQQQTENNQLKFDYHILLHDMVSQEIIHWKLLFTWSPAEGVKIQKTEQLPHVCEKPPNTN